MMTLNSDNLVLPIFDHREIKVTIPMLFQSQQDAVCYPEPNFRNLEDGMKAYVMNEGDQGFTDIYLIGYKY
jgi:hypothetical protein